MQSHQLISGMLLAAYGLWLGVALGLVMRFFFADWYLVVGIPVAVIYFLANNNWFGLTLNGLLSALVGGLTVIWSVWLTVEIPF